MAVLFPCFAGQGVAHLLIGVLYLYVLIMYCTVSTVSSSIILKREHTLPRIPPSLHCSSTVFQINACPRREEDALPCMFHTHPFPYCCLVFLQVAAAPLQLRQRPALTSLALSGHARRCRTTPLHPQHDASSDANIDSRNWHRHGSLLHGRKMVVEGGGEWRRGGSTVVVVRECGTEGWLYGK